MMINLKYHKTIFENMAMAAVHTQFMWLHFEPPLLESSEMTTSVDSKATV